MRKPVLLRTLRAKLAARVPVTLAELLALRERLRHELEPADDAAAEEKPKWREDLDRELHDEVVDELLGIRRGRDPG